MRSFADRAAKSSGARAPPHARLPAAPARRAPRGCSPATPAAGARPSGQATCGGGRRRRGPARASPGRQPGPVRRRPRIADSTRGRGPEDGRVDACAASAPRRRAGPARSASRRCGCPARRAGDRRSRAAPSPSSAPPRAAPRSCAGSPASPPRRAGWRRPRSEPDQGRRGPASSHPPSERSGWGARQAAPAPAPGAGRSRSLCTCRAALGQPSVSTPSPAPDLEHDVLLAQLGVADDGVEQVRVGQEVLPEPDHGYQPNSVRALASTVRSSST